MCIRDILKPILFLVHGHAHKGLLELVHLLFPGAGAHHIISTTLPLGLPGGDLSGKVLLGVLGLAVYYGIVVGIQIVAALSREAAEMRHRSAVIVGSGHFQLVHIQGENASLGIKPVSYTHLDVYKRQAMSRAERLSPR